MKSHSYMDFCLCFSHVHKLMCVVWSVPTLLLQPHVDQPPFSDCCSDKLLWHWQALPAFGQNRGELCTALWMVVNSCNELAASTRF